MMRRKQELRVICTGRTDANQFCDYLTIPGIKMSAIVLYRISEFTKMKEQVRWAIPST